MAPRQPGGSSTEERSERYELCLYVAGASPNSVAAIGAVTDACREELPGRHELKVIDIYQMPRESARDGVIAVPTLVKSQPTPKRRIVGNLADRGYVRTALSRIVHDSRR